LIAAVVVTRIYPTATFYLFPFRAWEMLMGGIAFLVEAQVKESKYRKLIAITGYLFILLSVVLLNIDLPWPGLYTLIPVAATFCVITGNYNDNKILGNEGIDFIGRVSYSLYLWHWPVFVLARYIGIEWNALSVFLMIALSFLLGYFSYRFIERLHVASSRLILATTLILCFGSYELSRLNINDKFFNPKVLDIANYERKHKSEINKQFGIGGCFLTNTRKGLKYLSKEKCLNIQPGKKNILLIGDSHAADLSQSLTDSLAVRNINLLQTTASGCLPILKANSKRNGEKECSDVINYIYHDFIPGNAAKIDGVILSASWLGVLKNGDKEELVNDIKNTLGYIAKYNIPVIIIGQNETYTIPYATIAAKEMAAHKKMSPRFINRTSGVVNGLLSEKFSTQYIDIYNSSIPLMLNNSIPYMFDNNHYTKYGADLTVHKIITNPITERFINRIGKSTQ
jgi:hypothetical protein